MTRNWLLCLVCAVAVWHCGEDVDELGPYVQKMKVVEKFDADLSKYQELLKSEDTLDEAKTIREVFVGLDEAIKAIPTPEDKTLKALHNALKRESEEGLTKLKDPDSITFVVNARKRSQILHESIVKAVNNLKREWEKEGRTDPFPISVNERL